MKKIGMVIVNYNDAITTARLLDNIKDYKCLNKIVVVDNHSTDDSLKELKKYENKKIFVIKNNNENGYASGMNTGAKYLIEKLGSCHIIFSNSDIIINSEENIKTLSSNLNKDIAVVGPVIYEHGNLNRGWKKTTVGQEIFMNLPLINRYVRKKIISYKENHYQSDTSIVGVVSGCFFMVDSKVLEVVDYFDQNTFLYYEELVFSKKLEKVNKKELIDNRIVVIHDHSVSIDKSIKMVGKYKILKDSQKYYVDKYLNANSIQKMLLYITNKLSLGIMYIRVLFRR